VRGGGWLILGHGKFGADPIADALNCLKTNNGPSAVGRGR
jgi:hypothetical protein